MQIDQLRELLPLIHCCATWAMIGLVWFVQVVHYPLFSDIPAEKFPDYEQKNCNRTGIVVLPLMLVELSSSLLLLYVPLDGVKPAIAAFAFLLLALIWLSTFLLQVPQHSKLQKVYDENVHRALVRSNMIRTAAWSIRGVLAGFLMM